MIVVIADDFTGAAEIAGIAVSAGFKNVQLTTQTDFSSIEADVLVVNSNTRSMSEESAIQIARLIAGQLIGLKPGFLYLKVDSVLRGHVAAELQVYMRTLSYKTAVIMPANPALGRTIEDGHYYVNGLLLNHTAFAHDPEFPKKSAKVTDMLGNTGSLKIARSNKWDGWEDGIYIPDAKNKEAVTTLAVVTAKEPFLLAGSSDYFSALLNAGFAEQINTGTKQYDNLKQLPKLLISGTTYRQSVSAISELKNTGTPVFYLQPVTEIQQEVVEKILPALVAASLTIIAFDQYALGKDLDAAVLRSVMANVVTDIVMKAGPLDIYIEGGATAAEILEQLACKNFMIVKNLAQGVVQMQAMNLPGYYLTVKPGSYAWHDGFIK
ncbi:four-carbon acid sugar kinase family protein [Polluticaenibacter yanchengensis]|uniref:Four-carbon acid sugar kinase family protein n=1 Tax=Polluticaenibacter yanchengensis TaxID=3014562 RepID=A0ABT4UFS4_9BACT|nr:four-carbon acid sugar kinase family protein [Chitinophagaceae bacterium LY-5]